MTKTNEHHAEDKDESKDHFSSDLESLKSSFAQLRDDVTRLLDNTLGTGKSGAEALKDRAAGAVAEAKDRIEELKDGGAESCRKFEEKMSERPLLSAAIALGIGFFLARLLSARR